MGNRIHSKGPYTHEEYDAGETGIYPGMLLKLAADGDVEIHDVEGARCEALFAEEDALQGKSIADVYVVDNPVMCILPGLGCEVRALIQDGQVIEIGDHLVSAGDGTLIRLADLDSGGENDYVVAVAMEALDLSGSADDNVLARVRIGVLCGT